MNILVCLKQILDPEISPRDFAIDAEQRDAKTGSANKVTNIFCENALETALQLRESSGGEITALTFGPAESEDVLRKALALRVDKAVRVDNPGIAHSGSAGSALAISAAAKKLGGFDLVLIGREAGDWGEGRTAGLVAEHLGLPFVAFVDQIESNDDGLRLHRQTDFGREIIAGHPPIVASITNCDGNVPRIPKTRDIMQAHRKEVTTWSLSDIGLDSTDVTNAASATEVVDLALPEKTAECEFVEGDTIDEKIDRLARRIIDIVQSS